MLIDLRKLDPLRTLIDVEIAEIALINCCSRPEAYLRLAANLGYYLRVSPYNLGGHLELVGAAAVPANIINSLKRPADLLPNNITSENKETLLREFSDKSAETECWAIDAEDACAGVIIRCLDKSADIYSDNPYLHFQVQEEWQKVYNGGVDIDCVVSNPDQRCLFETEDEYSARRQRWIRMKTFDAMWTQSIGNDWLAYNASTGKYAESNPLQSIVLF